MSRGVCTKRDDREASCDASSVERMHVRADSGHIEDLPVEVVDTAEEDEREAVFVGVDAATMGFERDAA